MNKQLETVKQAVDQWRLDPSTSLNKVPLELKNKILQLIPDYKPIFLAKYLGFGASTIGKWQAASRVTAKILPKQDFIEVSPLVLEASQAQSQLISVSFKRGDLQVNAQLSSEQFQHLFLNHGV